MVKKKKSTSYFIVINEFGVYWKNKKESNHFYNNNKYMEFKMSKSKQDQGLYIL